MTRRALTSADKAAAARNAFLDDVQAAATALRDANARAAQARAELDRLIARASRDRLATAPELEALVLGPDTISRATLFRVMKDARPATSSPPAP